MKCKICGKEFNKEYYSKPFENVCSSECFKEAYWLEIIKEKDHALDPKCVDDFCEFCGYSKSEFYAILDKMYNRDLFEKDEFGRWKLKNAIYEQ